MNILVIGGGGMVGVKLINRLAKDGKLGDTAITKIIRQDVVLPPPPPASSFPIETLIGETADLLTESGRGSDRADADPEPEVIHHRVRLSRRRSAAG